jgi:hypothetical protein
MNTPAHLALSILIWRNQTGWMAAAAVSFGAILPDMPIFMFYFYQKSIGTPEQLIWSAKYFEDSWQLLFDVFHLIPIALFIMLLSQWFDRRLVFLIAASSLLHMLMDLPLHHDDAHRHFLPLSQWRFESPVSYWDPRYYGHIMLRLEMVFVGLSCAYVLWRGHARPMRIIAGVTSFIYGGFMFYAYIFWA